MKNQNEGYSPSIAGWLARIFNVNESTMHRLVNIAAIVVVVVTCMALWQKWAEGN